MAGHKTIILIFWAVVLTSCSAFQAQPTITPFPTTTDLPTRTSMPEPTNTPGPLPTDTRTSPTQTPSIPISTIPTTIVMESGLTWIECVVPNRAYSMTKNDMKLLTMCVSRPEWGADDAKRGGERVKETLPYCCSMVPLFRGSEQYCFVGSREVITYLVSIQ